MPNDETLWELGSHTKGKHEVFGGYLDGWLPKLSAYNGRILIIDGFAGPGLYKGGEPGSPLIAIDRVRRHRELPRNAVKAEVSCLFIENDAARAKHLVELLAEQKVPEPFTYSVSEGEFRARLDEVFDSLDSAGKKLAPAFVMIDPFGVRGVPHATIERILAYDKTEVFVSVMWENINRFRERPEFEEPLTELFGTEEWKDLAGLEDSDERRLSFFKLYARQLKKAGAKHVVHFNLYQGNRLKYAIFFGTKNIEGCDLMKRCIWKVAPHGDYSYRGSDAEELDLSATPDTTELQRQLQEKFGDLGWVSVESVIRFVKSDATKFHSSHVKKLTLKPMEKDGLIEVRSTNGAKRKAGTFKDGHTEILFKPL